MITNRLRRKPTSIAKTRWVAYAAAGAASAVSGVHCAEAAVHYSGILDVQFPGGTARLCRTFPLDRPGDSIRFCHTTYELFKNFGSVRVNISGRTSYHNIRAQGSHISELSFGERISAAHQLGSVSFFPDIYDYNRAQWAGRGGGLLGFKFNSGKGVQYGWVRISHSGSILRDWAFVVQDYAYADPGEPLNAGQTSTENNAVIENSLGGLAIGALGLLAWRKSRHSKLATNR